MSQPPQPSPGKRLADRAQAWDDEAPAPRIEELIRLATSALIANPEELFESVDAAVLGTQTQTVLADAELTEAIRASNRSNLAHWAASNLTAPGLPVRVNRAEETVGLARVIARRGIEDTSRAAYGAGQNAAWTAWMGAVFSVTRDAAELQTVLEISARSQFAFVEAMLELLRREIERERSQVLSSVNARRLSVINTILRSGLSPSLASELRYPIDLFAQTAVVLSARNRPDALLDMVERVAGAVGPRLRRRPLTVLADADTAWAWFASDEFEGPIDRLLEQAFLDLKAGDVRVAIGPTLPGYDGFCRGHDDALAAAEVAVENVATYASVVVATLVRAEPERVRRFIAERIGRLEPEVKATLAAYLAHRGSPTRTAQATYTHRNTVIDRVRRAETQLPMPLAGHELEIALALELDTVFSRGKNPSWTR